MSRTSTYIMAAALAVTALGTVIASEHQQAGSLSSADPDRLSNAARAGFVDIVDIAFPRLGLPEKGMARQNLSATP
jgi:hypothetical protein